MKQLHEIQLQILKKLLFANSLKFSDLRPDLIIENNQLTFHLDKLIDLGYVKKSSQGYALTSIGKEYANRMDTDEVAITKQAKIGTIVICTRNSLSEYLIYTRLKQPFYGCQGFMSGKVRFGETILQTAKRELKEETGLEGNPTIIDIRHYLVVDKTSRDLLEDKFLYFCWVDNPKGKLEFHEEGKFEWVKEKDFASYVTNHFESFENFLRDVSLVKNFKGGIKFTEIHHRSSKF